VPLPAEEDDDPEWKSTGGVNPTLRGAIQVDVTKVSSVFYFILSDLVLTLTRK
jgi:hypothetical protein